MLRLPYSLKQVKLSKLIFPLDKIGRKKNFKIKQFFFRYLEYFPRYSSTGCRVLVGGWGFLYLQKHFSQNNFHHELPPHRRFELSKFGIYGHKISQGYSIITESPFTFSMVSVLDFYISNTRSFR